MSTFTVQTATVVSTESTLNSHILPYSSGFYSNAVNISSSNQGVGTPAAFISLLPAKSKENSGLMEVNRLHGNFLTMNSLVRIAETVF